LRFTDWPVRRKLVALIVAASLAPLAAAAVLDIGGARARLRANAADLLAAHANHLRDQLDAFHHAYLQTAVKLGRHRAVSALAAAPGVEDSVAEEVRGIIGVQIETDSNVRAIGVADRQGKVIMSTKPDMEGVLLERDYVDKAWKGTSTVSDMHVEPALGQAPVIAYAAPIDDGTPAAGLVVLWVSADALWALTDSLKELAGAGSYAVVLDGHGIRIAHSSNRALVFRPAGVVPPDEKAAMVAARRFGPDTRKQLDEVQPSPEQFARARAPMADGSLFRAKSPSNGQWNYGVAQRLKAVAWTSFCMLPERGLDDQIATMTRDKMILAGIIMFIALAVGLALAAVILRPVVSLSAATSVIAEGDLSARVPPVGSDEFGRLCESFNAMADRIERDDSVLRRARAELEERVAERTVELMQASITEARAREELEASTARLEILSRTGHELAAASGDAAGVFTLAAQRLSEVIGESCMIRLISDDGVWLEPPRALYHPDPEQRALANQAMANVRQRVGEGISGRVAQTGEAMLLSMAERAQLSGGGSGAMWPVVDVLGVASLLTLPLRSRDRTIGVVNLARNASGKPYTVDDQRFAQDVADRAGLAIDNAVLVATLERRVAARTAALEAANNELEAFSYSVSHDLRAPLRAIDGFSHALAAEYAERLDGEGQRYLERIRAATQRMGALIDDLLNLARITRVQPRWAPIDLSALAGQVAAELRRRDPERTTQFDIAPGVAGRGDARLLTIVLENLLGNAWKFTTKHAAAAISFGAEQRDGRVVYHVRDTGAGFDMRYADKLFVPFQRLHGASEYEGTGIGLATVQRIIARHGGQIWAEAEVDRGATFFFTLEDPR
jgi:signal transduction histidine kinase